MPGRGSTYHPFDAATIRDVLTRKAAVFLDALRRAGPFLDAAEFDAALDALDAMGQECDRLDAEAEAEAAAEARERRARHVAATATTRKSLSAPSPPATSCAAGPCPCWACAAVRRGIRPHAVCPRVRDGHTADGVTRKSLTGTGDAGQRGLTHATPRPPFRRDPDSGRWWWVCPEDGSCRFVTDPATLAWLRGGG